MKLSGKRSILSESIGLYMPCVLILLVILIPWEYGSAQESIRNSDYSVSASIPDYPYSSRHRTMSNYAPYYPAYAPPYPVYHEEKPAYYGNEQQIRSKTNKKTQKKTLKGIPVVLSGIVFLMLALYSSGLTYKSLSKKDKVIQSYKRHEANIMQGENLGTTVTAILSLILGVVSVFSGIQSIIFSIVPWAKSKLDEGDTQYFLFSIIAFVAYHLVSKRMNLHPESIEEPKVGF